MVYLLLILFAIVFFELFVLLRMSKDAEAIMALSQRSMRILMSSKIGDDERERFIRHGSAEIFKATFRFSMKFLSIVVIVCSLFALTVALFPDLRKEMIEGLVSPVSIVLLTASIVCYALIRKAMLAKA